MKFYPDEEENPEYWWDVELEDVRYEVYDRDIGEDDPYNQYRVWKGKVSRENKVASFKFVHHCMIDGDAELEDINGDFPEDLYDTLFDFLVKELVEDYDSACET